MKLFLAIVACLIAFAFAAPIALAQTTQPVMTCEQNVDYLKDLNAQLGNIAESFRTQLEIATLALGKVQSEIHAVVKATASKPIVVKAKSRPRACPIPKGNQKCKHGRWQSPKHNCKCGKW